MYLKDSNNKPYNGNKETLEKVYNVLLVEITKDEYNNLVEALNNPPKTPEEIKQYLTMEVDKHIQKKVDEYNKANGTLFASVHNCATYVLVDTYPHRQFCVDIINFNATVWEKARSIEADVLAEKREMPTIEEFIAELPVFGN